MFKYGLKLWSTNLNYVKEAERLYNKGIYSYIELFAVPGSFLEYKDLWAKLKIPYVIHAAHFRRGMNLAKKENEAKNILLIKEAQQFADDLKAESIIVHPGIDGDIKETARQLQLANDKRILIENKPYHALDDGLICNGTTPRDIQYIMREAGINFCLDISHAACSAIAHGFYYIDFIKMFLILNPAMFHMADGDVNNLIDDHRHVGEGNFDINQILMLIPDNAMITIETNKDSKEDLNDYIKDLGLLKHLGETPMALKLNNDSVRKYKR